MRWIFVLGAACFALACSAVQAAASPGTLRIAFVPLDDRPATALFPRQVAAICGATLEMPPSAAIGHFQTPGDPDAIGRWLDGLDVRGLTAVVLSSDMLAYGGLVASREAATPLADALYHLRPLTEFHRLHPDVPIYVFGTVMRLAPTATPQAERYLDALTHYAQLGGVAQPDDSQRAALAISRSNVPDAAFWDYLGARARDLDVDEALITMASADELRLLALGQDDAGSDTGLQVPDEARLHALVGRLGLQRRVLLNPGTDELGMVVVMRAVEDALSWSPAVAIDYPSGAAAAARDRLEYLPIQDTVANLAALLRARQARPSGEADFELAVNAPDPDPAVNDAFLASVAQRLRDGGPTAIADLTFLTGDPVIERRAFESLEAAGVASLPLAYASWNTTANSAGSALAQAAATAIGAHFGTLDASAAATFLFERYADDYGYRLLVRDPLQAQLRTDGVDVYALGDDAARGESLARAMLWPVGLSIYDRDFAPHGFGHEAIAIHLPWQRTFEVRIDAALTAP